MASASMPLRSYQLNRYCRSPASTAVQCLFDSCSGTWPTLLDKLAANIHTAPTQGNYSVYEEVPRVVCIFKERSLGFPPSIALPSNLLS